MKQINKIKVMVLTWSVLLIVSCTNPAKNNASIVDKPNENQVVAVDTVTQSKITSEVIEKEVIDGWLKESIKQQVVIDKIGNPEKKERTSIGVQLEPMYKIGSILP
jgi:competence protein ComGC